MALSKHVLELTLLPKNNKIAISDNLRLRKHYAEIDGQRYPRDSFLMNFEEKDYIEQYRGLKLIFKENIREPILNPSISNPDMKTKYPIEIIGLRHQLDHMTGKFNYSTNKVLILRMLDFFLN